MNDTINELILIGFGGTLVFLLQFSLRGYLETRNKRIKLAHTIIANIENHQKIILEVEVKIGFDTELFTYLLTSGEITLFSKRVVIMIMQYKNLLASTNKLMNRAVLRDELMNNELKNTGNSLRKCVQEDHLTKSKIGIIT